MAKFPGNEIPQFPTFSLHVRHLLVTLLTAIVFNANCYVIPAKLCLPGCPPTFHEVQLFKTQALGSTSGIASHDHPTAASNVMKKS